VKAHLIDAPSAICPDANPVFLNLVGGHFPDVTTTGVLNPTAMIADVSNAAEFAAGALNLNAMIGGV
jgi:hypothetical protein